MLSVHTTYPLYGWARSRANKCSTKPVGGSSIGAGGGGADLTFPETQGRLHNPKATSCGRMHPRSGKAGWYGGYLVYVSVAGVSSFYWVPPGWIRFEWVQVYNPWRVKTIRIAASSVMDNPTLLLLLFVSVTHVFYLSLLMTTCLGQLRCKEWEFSHRLGGY
jgi:hypothetical protein